MKTPILATGISGLVGSRIVELLGDRFQFTDLSFATGIDITDASQVEREVEKSSAPVILHMAAKADVDRCEDDKVFGEDGAAWQVNVFGTRHVVDAARKTGKRIIYISTDFVFEGSKQYYTEDDEPDPVNWYGETKREGEKIVQNGDTPWTIVRIAYPYRAHYAEKKDFVRRILQTVEEKKEVVGITDHVFTPTFIDDIAAGLKILLSRDCPGIYHLVGSSFHPVIDAVKMILSEWHIAVPVLPVSRERYFRSRAFRPRNVALKNDKIKELGISMLTFPDGLKKMKDQMDLSQRVREEKI